MRHKLSLTPTDLPQERLRDDHNSYCVPRDQMGDDMIVDHHSRPHHSLNPHSSMSHQSVANIVTLLIEKRKPAQGSNSASMSYLVSQRGPTLSRTYKYRASSRN